MVRPLTSHERDELVSNTTRWFFAWVWPTTTGAFAFFFWRTARPMSLGDMLLGLGAVLVAGYVAALIASRTATAVMFHTRLAALIEARAVAQQRDAKVTALAGRLFAWSASVILWIYGPLILYLAVIEPTQARKSLGYWLAFLGFALVGILMLILPTAAAVYRRPPFDAIANRELEAKRERRGRPEPTTRDMTRNVWPVSGALLSAIGPLAIFLPAALHCSSLVIASIGTSVVVAFVSSQYLARFVTTADVIRHPWAIGTFVVICGVGLGLLTGAMAMGAIAAGVLTGMAAGHAPAGYEYHINNNPIASSYSVGTPLLVIGFTIGLFGAAVGVNVSGSRPYGKIVKRLDVSGSSWSTAYFAANVGAFLSGIVVTTVVAARLG